jgi:hypothetical protein
MAGVSTGKGAGKPSMYRQPAMPPRRTHGRPVASCSIRSSRRRGEQSDSEADMPLVPPVRAPLEASAQRTTLPNGPRSRGRPSLHCSRGETSCTVPRTHIDGSAAVRRPFISFHIKHTWGLALRPAVSASGRSEQDITSTAEARGRVIVRGRSTITRIPQRQPVFPLMESRNSRASRRD